MTPVNGSIVQVQCACYTGEAGLQGKTVAFVPTNVAKKLVSGDAIKISGEDRKVRFVSPSAYVKGMILVTFD